MRMGSVTPASMVVSGGRSFTVSLSLPQKLQISHSSLNNYDTNYTMKCCSPVNTLSAALTSDSESSRAYLASKPTASSSTDCLSYEESSLILSPTSFAGHWCRITYPKHDRLLPCPSHDGAPKIEHLIVSEDGPVLEYICKTLDFPPSFVADLIRLGAVYFALVSPQPPSTAPQEQIRRFKEATEPSVLSKRSSTKGMTIQQAQKTFRVTNADQFVEAGTYLRVYVYPKRFPRCYEIDWRSRIIAVTESYVVLDKPAGASVGGTTNNIEETCTTFTTRASGLSTPLLTTHQIDNCTEGCVVFARTKEFGSIFHGKIREKKVKKLYLAPLPCGITTHYLRPVSRASRLISEDYMEGWNLRQLEVMECRKVPWPSTVIQYKYCIEGCGWPSLDYAYECKINFITGKTHPVCHLHFSYCENHLSLKEGCNHQIVQQ